jgi:hypothetical protein
VSVLVAEKCQKRDREGGYDPLHSSDFLVALPNGQTSDSGYHNRSSQPPNKKGGQSVRPLNKLVTSANDFRACA